MTFISVHTQMFLTSPALAESRSGLDRVGAGGSVYAWARHEPYLVQQRLALRHFSLWTLQLNDADEEGFLPLILTGVTQGQRVRLHRGKGRKRERD